MEILKTWEWYEEKESGLGNRFIRSLSDKIGSVLANPLHYPLKGKHQEAQMEFPFLIVYQFIKRNNLIIIVSVFHTSRHPKGK